MAVFIIEKSLLGKGWTWTAEVPQSNSVPRTTCGKSFFFPFFTQIFEAFCFCSCGTCSDLLASFVYFSSFFRAPNTRTEDSGLWEWRPLLDGPVRRCGLSILDSKYLDRELHHGGFIYPNFHRHTHAHTHTDTHTHCDVSQTGTMSC